MDYVKLNVDKADRQKLKTFAARLDITIGEAFNVAAQLLAVAYGRLEIKYNNDSAAILQAILEGDFNNE